MFDIGFQELLLIAVIALLVMGPERLPGAIRTASLWLGRLRNSFQQIKADIEREVGADEIKRQLHNEALLKRLEEAKNELEETTESLQPNLHQLEHNINEAVNPQKPTRHSPTTDHD